MAGETLYTRCTGCHSPAYNRTGPKHCGISGRAAGGVKGFNYTQALKNSGITWTRDTLNQFLLSPFTMIPGTSMGFIGISSPEERSQLVSYLMHLNEGNEQCN